MPEQIGRTGGSPRSKERKFRARRACRCAPPPDYAFTQDEQAGLLDKFRQVFLFDEQEIDTAREDLQHGNDALLKLLLFGFCPRLWSLKLTRHFHPTSRGALERTSFNKVRDEPRSTLGYFHQAVLVQIQNKSSAWPMGLDSLQDLGDWRVHRRRAASVAFQHFAIPIHRPYALAAFGLFILLWLTCPER